MQTVNLSNKSFVANVWVDGGITPLPHLEKKFGNIKITQKIQMWKFPKIAHRYTHT